MTTDTDTVTATVTAWFVFIVFILIVAGCLKLYDLCSPTRRQAAEERKARYLTQRRVQREIDKKLGEESKKRQWPTHLFRFGCSYGLYVGCAFVFVSNSKVDLLWVIGIVVAAAATYLWNQLSPINK